MKKSKTHSKPEVKSLHSKGYDLHLSDIQDAKQELRKYLDPSPLLKNVWLSEVYGCELYLKLENMQPIGSFKIRGAAYKVASLTPAEKKRGVIAASAGNHAQGVAWGAQRQGVKACIIMPNTAPLMKIQNTRALGAEIILHGNNYDEAFQYAQTLAKKTGAVYVHAFDDPFVIAGQGTCGLEIIEQLPEVDMVIGSIGGGGLMAGVSIVMKELRPQAKLIGCQAAGAASMVESIKKGHAIELEKASTFADGINVRRARESLRKILAPRLDETYVADDEEIAAGILMLMEKAKVVAEGAGALPLAVLDKMYHEDKRKLRGKTVVLIISGGNIDVNVLGRVIDRGLIRAGRRVRINVIVSDRPGSLARLSALIAQLGANVLQSIHSRNDASTRIDQTEVALTLETRGPEHSQEILKALKKEFSMIHVH